MDERLGTSFLLSQSEDVLISILSFLDPPNIIRFSLTCKKIWSICNLRIVWTNAGQNYVIYRGYPFAFSSLSSSPMPQLKFKVLSAYYLAHRWLSGVTYPRRICSISGTSGTCVSDVRFIPGYDDRLLLTISKTIWSAMSLWSLSDDQDSQMVAHWSPRGAIFTGHVVNGEEGSKATFAISLQLDGEFSVKVFHVVHAATYAFQEIYSVATDMKPVTLLGDILALADASSQTAIWNWKEGTYAILRDIIEEPSRFQNSFKAPFQQNDCLQVLFAHESVLVVRARSIHLFPYPDLRPHDVNSSLVQAECSQIAQHSFGWVDGIVASVCPHLETSKCAGTPISILVRGESDDPWAQDDHYLELYSLLPNSDYPQQKLEMQELDKMGRGDSDPGRKSFPRLAPPSPYDFPPCKIYRIKSCRGALRCKQVMLGKFGTAAWIEPQERFSSGLVTGLVAPLMARMQRHECIRVAVFPGSLAEETETDEVESRRVVSNEANNWTSFDYDEVGGRIVLGSSFGRIVVIKV